jgi:3-deoxy-D-manno-octulosonic-acid transferase
MAKAEHARIVALSIWPVASYLLLPYAVLSLLWRALRYRPYAEHWPERFGFMSRPAGRRIIWVHAVSVGEVRSAAALVQALQSRYPSHTVLVTTMTPTGAEQVRKLFGGSVEHRYLPYDVPDMVARFLDRIRPELALIAETEFWPNLFAACRRRNIPLFLVNVRISASALAGYLRMPQTARTMFTSAELVCAQTRTDAQRLRNLGVMESGLFVTGNLKFDAPVPSNVHESGRALRRQWGEGRAIWVAGSTHAGEESKLLDTYSKLKSLWPSLLLVLVPRNPERFGSVYRYCRIRRLSVVRRSAQDGEIPVDVDVVLGDTMGELQHFYAAADVAFVGASLVKLGGHNILEACAVGVPVVFGPHMFHCEDVAALAVECGAARQVYDAAALAEAVDAYLGNAELRRAAGVAALRMVEQNCGSLELTLELVSREMRRLRIASVAAAGLGAVSEAGG